MNSMDLVPNSGVFGPRSMRCGSIGLVSDWESRVARVPPEEL